MMLHNQKFRRQKYGKKQASAMKVG
jgi:hypothetical protein